MHARDSLEVAALVVLHGPALISSQTRISPTAIEQYWTASKSRLDRWAGALKSFGSSEASDGRSDDERWNHLRPVLEEILIAEILTRVWTALLSAHDRRHQLSNTEPIGRSVMLGHLEARQRVLGLLVSSVEVNTRHGLVVERLRRQAERWTDLLLGHLLTLEDVGEFAIDADRAREFSEDLRHQARQGNAQSGWALTLVSLRGAFRQGLSGGSPNPDLNSRIASSVLACFPSELFDSTGVFQSLWLLRLTSYANDAQGMIQELLCSDDSADRTCRPNRRNLRWFSE